MALMMRFRWNKSYAADSCWLPSPRNAAERGMVPEGIHAKAAEATLSVRFPAPDNAHPNAGVMTVPDGGGGIPRLGERAGHVPLPVDGLNGPSAPVHGLPSALDLEAEPARALEPDAEVQLWGLGESLQVVDFCLAVALVVVPAPVWGKLRLHVHLMMSLFEIFDDWPVRVWWEGQGGDGPARKAAPDDTGPLGSQWLAHGNRTLLIRRFQHRTVGQGFICGIRLPGLMAPCAGQPTMVEARRRTCAKGDPGEVFPGQGDVRVSVVCTSWLPSLICC